MKAMPKEAYGVGALVAALLTLLFLVTYSGPYRILADLQVAWFHTHIVNISFWVTMLFMSAPILAVVYLLERRLGTRQTWFTPIWNNLDHIFDLWPGKLLLIGATLLVMGTYFAVKDLGRGSLTMLSVSELEQGHPPRGTYVELADGTILKNTNLRFTSNGTTYRYLPVVDRAEVPVLFLRVSEREGLHGSPEKIRGILDLNAMEGELRSQLEAAHAIGTTHYVLGVGRKPEPALGGWMAFIGIGLSFGGLVWWRVRYAPADERITTARTH
jgi:hypothetical protein